MNFRRNPTASSAQILIVEDSPTQAEQLRYHLENATYRVMLAGNGQEALDLLARNKPNLVISDVVMPSMGGYELCQRIKADPYSQDIQVILLTSLSDKQDVLEGLACGADSFITKPYSHDYLLTHIQQILSENPLPQINSTPIEMEISSSGKVHLIKTDPQRMLRMLLSTSESAVHRNAELAFTQDRLHSLNEHLEELVRIRTAALSAEVNERKHAQSVLQANEARTRTIIEGSSDGLVIVAEDGIIRFVNPAAETLFGRSAEDLVGTDLGFLITTENPIELEIIRPDGSVVVVEMRATELVWEEKPAFLASLRDVTERNRVQEAERQLALLKEDFIAGVSHDLRTPINGIVGFLDLLRSGKVEDPTVQEEFLERMAWDANRLKTMVSELLDFSQMDREQIALNWDVIDLGGVIVETLKSLQPLPDMKQMVLKPILKNEPLIAEADEARIRRVLVNLVENAIRFSEEGATVVVSGERDTDNVIIKVIDSGCGMSGADRAKVFGKYFQAPGPLQRASGGVGLGLFTSKRIIEEHGGTIKVDSRLGEGSEFTIKIPIKRTMA